MEILQIVFKALEVVADVAGSYIVGVGCEDDKREEVRTMKDKEKKIIELLKEELPRMSDFKKGYLLGMVEEMAGNKKKAR